MVGMRKCLSCCVSLAIMAVLAGLLWNFLGRPSKEDAQDFLGGLDFGDFSNVLKNITDFDWGKFYNEDPFVGDNTTNAWKTKGTGLTLELQNALDDNWQKEFETAIGDWGESDVLTLIPTRVAVDHSCAPVKGVMVVCNGNFGETGWVGINEVEIEYAYQGAPGFITNSVAKMNEFYLYNADWTKRRYTMCHEIGHGFGLPHTDENPNNSDLGNCLDYTNHPENNQLPGEVNFQRLRSIYLAGEGQNQQGQGSTPQQGGEGDIYGQVQEDDDSQQDDSVQVQDSGHGRDNNGRYLRRVILRHYLYERDFQTALN